MSTVTNIVIVGAGFAGISTWNFLSTTLDAKKHNLVLITPRPYLTYLPAAHRMVVTAEGELQDSCLMPLDDRKYNSGNKKMVVASVVSIVEKDSNQGGHVVLDNGGKVDYSILVLTPGMLWQTPLHFPETNKAEALVAITSWRERFGQAKNIVIVGGGAVGLELSGELRDLGSDRNITIVHGQPLFLNDTYPEHWRKTIAKQWSSRGIHSVMGDYVDDLSITDRFVTTRGGKRILADLVVSTRGGRPNTDFVRSLGTDVLTASGGVKVAPTLQLIGHPRIFAGGDVIDWKEQKGASKTEAHASVIKHNILVLLGLTKKGTISYKGYPELLFLTNGKSAGLGYASYLWGITFAKWIVVWIKSKSLLISLTKARLGLD